MGTEPKPEPTKLESKPRGRSGPKTVAGKLAVSVNATRHGLLSSRPVAIAGLEDAEAWQRHLSAVHGDLRPVGYLESSLVDLLALNLWRLLRAQHAEAQIIATVQARAFDLAGRESELDEPETPDVRMRRIDAWRAKRLLLAPEELEALGRHEAHLHRSALKTLATLKELQRDRQDSPAGTD